MLEIGEKAPDFTLASTGGAPVHLYEELPRHGAIVVLFYVLDFTPG